MSTEFHWDGKDGAVRSNGLYAVLVTKPDIPGVQYDIVSFVAGGLAKKIIGGQVLDLTDAEKQALSAFATQHATSAAGSIAGGGGAGIDVTDPGTAVHSALSLHFTGDASVAKKGDGAEVNIHELDVKEADGEHRVNKVTLLKTLDMDVRPGDNPGEAVIKPRPPALQTLGLHLEDDHNNVYAGIDGIVFSGATLTEQASGTVVVTVDRPAATGDGQITLVNLANPDNKPEVAASQIDLVYPLEANQNGQPGQALVRLKEGIFQDRQPDGFLAYLKDETVVIGQIGAADRQRSKLWFDDVVVDATGLGIETDRVNKAFSIQEDDQLDPNLTDGTNFLVVVRIAMRGDAPVDGDVRVELRNSITDDLLTDVSGGLMAIQRSYKAQEPLGEVTMLGILNAKGAVQFHVCVEDSFDDQVLLEDRTEGGSCVMIQTLHPTFKTGPALLQLENDLNTSFKFSSHYLGVSMVDVRALLFKPTPLTLSSVGNTTLGDGWYVMATADYSIQIAETAGVNALTLKAGDRDPLYFAFGNILSKERTRMLRGKSVVASIVATSPDQAFVIHGAYTTKEGIKQEPVASEMNSQPIMTQGWTMTVEHGFISEGQDRTPVDVTFTVPQDAVDFAIFLTPVQTQTPSTMVLYQFAVSVAPGFTSYVFAVPQDNSVAHLKYSREFVEFGEGVPSGDTAWRYTVNSKHTPIPVGKLIKGKGPAASVGTGGNNSGEQGRLVFSTGGEVRVSTTVIAYSGEKADPNGGIINLAWAFAKEPGNYDIVKGTERIARLPPAGALMVTIPTLHTNVQKGDQYILLAWSDVDDGAYLQAYPGQYLSQTEVEFDTILTK